MSYTLVNLYLFVYATRMSRGPEPDAESATDREAVGAVLFGLVGEVLRRTPRDLSLTSLLTLSTLERTGPRRITDLAEIGRVTQPAMTTAVSGLERSGLVERQGDPADKRVALVAITDAGLKALQARRRTTAQTVQQLIDKLPDDEAATLQAAAPALDHLRELAAEAWELPPSTGEEHAER